MRDMMPYMRPNSGLVARLMSRSFERAKREGRTIITADLDYPRLLALAQSAEPSLILFRDGDWSEADVIARMAQVLAALTEADIAQSIIVIEKDRLRRRRLPLGS